MPVGNALRSLFLNSALTQPDESPGAGNAWLVPSFATELAKATAGHGVAAAAAVEAVKAAVFDGASGNLTWEPSWPSSEASFA